MGEQFTNNKNKELLWGLLIEQKSFNGIDTKHKSNIELVFERTIKIIDSNLKNELLFNKNKEVIKEMVVYLNTLRRPMQSQVAQQTNIQNYTYDEIHKAKLDRFDNELKQKQKEFDSIIKKDAPNSIDFSDKMDEKIGDKMDLLISQTITMRENQLKEILNENTPNNPTPDDLTSPLFQMDSINNNNIYSIVNNKENTKNINRDYIKLNIGEDIDIDEKITKNIIVDLNSNTINKKVKFDESQNVYNYENDSDYKTNHTKLNSFLNKLKQVDADSTNLNHVINNNEKVSDINAVNQVELIINLLNTINLKLDKVLSKK